MGFVQVVNYTGRQRNPRGSGRCPCHQRFNETNVEKEFNVHAITFDKNLFIFLGKHEVMASTQSQTRRDGLRLVDQCYIPV